MTGTVVLPCRLSDAELVHRCRRGDDDAWREVVQRYSRYVYAIAVQAFRLPDADADDVFQDVFARAYGHLGGLRDASALRPWIGQLARRLCVDRLRAGRRVEPTDELAEPAQPDETLRRIDDALVVRDALAQLPEHAADILDRFFARDQSYQEIAAQLGIPPGTIASRISRALARLRDVLEPTV